MTTQSDALPACPHGNAPMIDESDGATLTDHWQCSTCDCDCAVWAPTEAAARAAWRALCAPNALAASRAEVERERASKDGAYDERNRLVAVLAALYPSSLERHPDEDTTWENDWRWIVFVDLPTGQATWHIHDSHLPLFDHVPRFAGRKWDGHNTEAKYKRIEAMAALAAQGGGT